MTYWLYLEPYTIVFKKKDEILLYNSLTFKSRLFKNTSTINQIISSITNLENMGCIEITDEDRRVIDIEEFIDFVRKSYSGDLIPSCNIKRPVIFSPVMKIAENTLTQNNEDLFELLSEIYLYIGGDNPTSNLNSLNISKQFDYCIKTEGKFLPAFTIMNFLKEFLNMSHLNINILGGNIFSYQEFKFLLSEFSKLPYRFMLYSNYLDIPKDQKVLRLLRCCNLNLKLLIDFPIDFEKLDNIMNILLKEEINIFPLFAVTSITDYENSESIIKKYCLPEAEIKPVFNYKNLDFFQEHVYLSENDIINTKYSKQGIFLKQSLNLFNFGKLRVMPNGEVFSDLNQNKIGNIGDKVSSLLNTEMNDNKSWLKLRTEEPCIDCIYQWLCPSPSGYESIIGKSNLCSVK